ncbi:maleylpyruvate isomerase family mycothiol-dependent enzyme [Actinomadura barringtoniae]|uniref:Maleylpyruvate isomerase family mycothiol-dependent enzyme n=1 Tax=Actinomadura barringtoniae TaxID=1427535 RepID=A0A939T4H1_9ACTN|nr:maleylpyruvate isomerase family mycothiol-dependent enzyme [Actinomadura barringtoniae]MBO2449438.1 maleylpyruvate isomerase family mycothiol-dependent enzyme [Actinomadura barringtoniae]
MDILDDLAAEYAALDSVLSGLTPDLWARPSLADGWSVADVILHLAQSEELVLASVSSQAQHNFRDGDNDLDDVMDRAVASERGASGADILARWRKASSEVHATLSACPPGEKIAWATVPLPPRTLATTRLAEHWAHALDVTVPLGIDYPDTARLWHIARLGQRTLPYAFTVAGEEGGPVHCKLTGPDGEEWEFGDADAPSVISGPAGEFCRVGARRVAPEDTTLSAIGPHAATALRVLRNYAV